MEVNDNESICYRCGNIIHSMGEMAVSCHGVRLMPNRHIDGKDKQYDDINERRELEKTVDKLFG